MDRPRAEIRGAFRERGVRCTPQRYVILEYLSRTASHPSAEQIFEAINRSDPRASLATVYKSLHALVRAGLVRELNLGPVVRFESRTERHHHFVCERCGRVEDIDWFDVPQLARRTTLGKRSLRDYALVLRGLCAHCS